MHAIHLLLISAVTMLMAFSILINMSTISSTLAMCRALTTYTRALTTPHAYSYDTDGPTGTLNGSPKLYAPTLPSSAIKIPSFDWDKGKRYPEWQRFRIELDSIFDTPTYASLTAKNQIVLILHWMG